MNTYEFKVIEIITKYVTVEAESLEEAEEIAYQTDMDSNFDGYSLDAELIDTDDEEMEG